MQEGSENAFTTLYRHYGPQLYMGILRMVRDPLLAEEIVQDLFTRVWQKESKGMKENFAGYLYRMGQHLVHDFFRRMQRDRLLLERFRSMVEEDNAGDIEEALHLRQSTAVLEKAIQQLSPQQKKVYELVRMKGCTYKEAAAIMGISPITVKEYLVDTKKSIKTYMISHINGIFGLLLLTGLWCCTL